jgi:histone H3/H4
MHANHGRSGNVQLYAMLAHCACFRDRCTEGGRATTWAQSWPWHCPRCTATPCNHRCCVFQIRKYQRNTHLLIRRAPFLRLVQEIAAPLQSNQLRDHFRWQGDAVTALQHAAEVLATMLPLMHAHGAVMHAKKLCYWAKLYFGCPRLCASRLLDLIVAGLLSWGVRGHQFLRYTC